MKKDIKQRWTKLETRRLIQHFNIEGIRQGIAVDTCVAHWTFGGFSYHIWNKSKAELIRVLSSSTLFAFENFSDDCVKSI